MEVFQEKYSEMNKFSLRFSFNLRIFWNFFYNLNISGRDLYNALFLIFVSGKSAEVHSVQTTDA